MILKKIVTTYKNNWIGAIAGAGTGYYIAKKSNKKFELAVAIVLGSIAGVMVNSVVSAKIAKIKNKNVIES